MVSAESPLRSRPDTEQPRGRLWWPLALAIPFAAAGWYANHSLFLSDSHAHLIEKALMALDRGRLELIGFVYPPLPFLMLLVRPTPWLASGLAALAGGATAWVLWTRLRATAFPVAVKVLVLVATMAVPSTVYLASQSLAEMVALLLWAVAWVAFLQFTRRGETRFGFFAGLALGLAFFVSYYAILVAILYALFVPLFMRDRGRAAAFAAAVVMFFPAVIAVGAWCYVNWVFTGDPLTFTRDPACGLFAWWRPASNDLTVGWPLALRSVAGDLLSHPVYLAVGALVALRPFRLPVFLAPLVLIAAVRASGMVFPSSFAAATLSVVALGALHPRMPRLAWPALALAALAHLAIGYVSPPTGELASWSRVMTEGRASASDLEEQEIGRALASKPPRSVLVDDRAGYRIVARAGTAGPFLLPADPLYSMAESQPAAFARFVMVPLDAVPLMGGRLTPAFAADPPDGVRLVASWRAWRLYETANPGGSASGAAPRRSHG